MGKLGLGAYAGYPRASVETCHPSLILCHENPSAAEAARASNPHAYVILRSDDGRDQEQPSAGDPAGHARWWAENKIKPKLARAKAGTYDCVVAYNENIPGGDPAAHEFRGALEYETCKIVQGELKLHYAAIACSVGNINAQHIHYYAPAIKAARWVNYHGYLRPLRKLAAEETEPWWLWRPLDLWLPELRRLGIPLRLLLGECGTYSDPKSTGISRGEMLRQCVEIDRLMATKCQALGVEYGGAIPFGFGTLGTMEVWDLADNEGLVNWAGQQAPSRGVWLVPAPPKPAPQPGGETVTAKLWVAIIPSNQDHNPVLGGTHEMAQMALLAAQLLAASRKHTAVQARVFTGKPESADTYQYQGLHEQQQVVYRWLETAPAGTLTVCFNIHSDSGTQSHVGWYYCGGQTSVSYRLAKRLGTALAEWFGTDVVLSADYSDYIFAGEQRGRNAPVLLEVGSHQNAHDIDILRAKGPAIADDLMSSILQFFGLALGGTAPSPTPPPPPVDAVTAGLDGIAHWGTQARAAAARGDIPGVTSSLDSQWACVVRLKQALGKQ